MARPRRRLPALTVTLAAVLAASLIAGCDGEATTAEPTPTHSPSQTSTPSPTETTSSPPAETPKQLAERLATEQTKAYFRTYFRVYSRPNLQLSTLDAYARDQALLDAKSAIQERRDRGERWVGRPKITKTWLGAEGVAFNEAAPMAVVDLYVCYDLNGSHRVDREGNRTPIEPQVAEARYAVYADNWPSASPSEWRVGKEFTAGEPCAR